MPKIDPISLEFSSKNIRKKEFQGYLCKRNLLPTVVPKFMTFFGLNIYWKCLLKNTVNNNFIIKTFDFSFQTNVVSNLAKTKEKTIMLDQCSALKELRLTRQQILCILALQTHAKCNRDEWTLSESWQKTSSEACFALVYVLVLSFEQMSCCMFTELLVSILKYESPP